MIQFEHLLNQLVVDDKVRQWLAEDLDAIDVAGSLVGNALTCANLYCKHIDRVVLAGRPFVNSIFRQLNCSIEWIESRIDGDIIEKPQLIAIVTGPANSVLLGERTSLNILSRACGIATLTRQCVDKIQSVNSHMRIAATRKTTPGFRLVEKYAVIVGGGDTHRYDLSSMIMLKDNHVDLYRRRMQNNDMDKFGVNLITQAKKLASFSQRIEIECRNREEALHIADHQPSVDVIMLDNFDPSDAIQTAQDIKRICPNIIVEISGGINLQTIDNYLAFDNHNHIDIVSMSILTQGYSSIDFSLKIDVNQIFG